MVLFQAIQFSIGTQFNSIGPIEKTLASATTLGQSGVGSEGNKVVLCVPKSSNLFWGLTIRLFMSYPGYLSGVEYNPSAEVKSVYSTARPTGVKCKNSFILDNSV